MLLYTHVQEDESFSQPRALGPFLRRMLKASYRYKKWFWLLLFGAGGIAAVDGLLPILWMRYIDNLITPLVSQASTGHTLMGFLPFALGFLGAFVLQALAIGAFIYCAGQLKERVIFDLREEMFAKLQHLSFSFYDRKSIGHLAIRLTSDVKKVTQVISWGLGDVLFGFIMILVSLTAMFIYNWQLSLIVLAVIPLLLILAIRVRLLLLRFARTARRTYSEMAAYLTEHINGLEVNKSTVQEKRAAETFRDVSGRLEYASYKSSLYSALYHPIVVGTGSVAAAMVIWFGGHLAVQAEAGITIGLLAAFFGYARMIFEPIFDITRYYASAQDSLSAGERIFSLIDEEIEIKDSPGLSDFSPIRGEIEFRDIDFSYVPEKPILTGFNLHIPAGQSVALVGATGSGKSTLASLIGRFYEPQKGELCIDGIPYRSRTLHSYREQLGVIQQTPHLFSGTLRENLQYGKLDASDAEIAAALRHIGAEEFVSQLDEEVGEEGSRYSAGEKQLIAFARALLTDPRILVMDEATSSVDTLAEIKVQRGVQQLIKGRTALIIAHRLSTIRDCDRILVMQDGQIIEDGSHEELLAARGAYYGLYVKQARKLVGA